MKIGIISSYGIHDYENENNNENNVDNDKIVNNKNVDDSNNINNNNIPNDEPNNNPSSNDENEDSYTMRLIRNPNTELPVYVGKLPIACSRHNLEYRIGTCGLKDQEEEKLIKIAMATCKIACVASDISRGRPVPPALERLLSKSCVDKLTNSWKLLDDYFKYKNDTKTLSMICSMPAIPCLVNGILTSTHHFEGIVHISTGPVKYWATLALDFEQNRWVCTYADIG